MPPPGCPKASAMWSCAASCESPRAASTTPAPWSPPCAPSAPRPPPTRRRRCPRAPRPRPTDLADGATLSAPGVDPAVTLGPPHRAPASSPPPRTSPPRRGRLHGLCAARRGPEPSGHTAAAPWPRRRPACGARRARRRRRHGHPPSAARARRRTARGRCPDAPDPAGTHRGSPRAYSARARRRRAYDPRPHGGRTVRACGPLGANRAGPDGQRPAARP
jgi:hypothetical protein